MEGGQNILHLAIPLNVQELIKIAKFYFDVMAVYVRILFCVF